ncbi:MAG: ComEC/Rec2 family competence protein [Chloroflexi bacterium]|nr:ComEC/Rec2 family competence protein [Chloroflexota bacterium]
MRIVYLALAWMGGILLSKALPAIPLLGWVWLAVIGLLLMRTRVRWLVLILALGALRMAVMPSTADLAQYNGLGGLTVEGLIVGEPDRRDDRVQITIAADTVTRLGATTPTNGQVLVYAPPSADARPGDRVRATGTLTTPGTWDRFSYQDYLARSGIYSLMRDGLIETLTPVDSVSPLITLRQQAADHIAAALPEPAAGLLTGILLGNERGIAPEVADAFSVTGTAHVIAISGFNMVLISGMVIGSLRRLRVPRRLAAVISISVIVTYTIFVGGSAAVTRAAVLCILLVIAENTRRKTYTPASLAFAALLLSLINPTVLWDAGFQLSFFAALGLTAFSEPIAKRLNPLFGLPAADDDRAPTVGQNFRALIAEPLITTLAVAIFIIPLTALHFGRLSAVMPFVNVLIIPVQPAILVLGGLATLIAFAAPIVAQVIYWLTLVPLTWTIEVVRVFARVPAFDTYPHPNFIAVTLTALIGVAMLTAKPRWIDRIAAAINRLLPLAFAGCAAILVLTAAAITSRPDGRLHVWFLDMGGGNAALITTPGGAHILIDGGRYPSRLLTALGDRLPFTDRALEAVILTQPDERQYGALPAVLSRYSAGALLTHGQPNLSPAYGDLLVALAPYPVVTARAGYTLTVDDGVRIEVLHPAAPPDIGAPLDDNALVLRLTYGETSFLFTSELSRAGQAALLSSGETLGASVLQLPGNGFTRSLDADFLAAVDPQVVVVQADGITPPDPDVLSMVEALPLFRTDHGGTIELVSDGDDVWVSEDR